MPLPPQMHLWEPMCLFPQWRAFFTRWLVLATTWPLECQTVETSYHAQHVWICIANCGYAKVFVLTESWGTLEYKFSFASSSCQWCLCEHSRLCFEIFLCVGIPQHYGLQRNVSHGTLLLPLGSREHHLSTSKKIFHLGVYPQKQTLRQLNFSVALRRGLAKNFSFGVSQWKDHDLPWPFIFRSSLHHAIPLFIEQVSTHAKDHGA